MSDKWIPVDKRLPKKYDDYLCWTSYGFMAVCEFFPDGYDEDYAEGFYSMNSNGTRWATSVTHWIVAPAPPSKR